MRTRTKRSTAKLAGYVFAALLFHAGGIACVWQLYQSDTWSLSSLGWVWATVTLAAITPTWW